MGSRLDRQSDLVRKRIQNHAFSDEAGEEYEASAFGGFTDYFRRKKIKLQNLDAEMRASSSKPQIFKGIVCYVNGYTQPSLNDLHALVVQHGGGFLQYLSGKTMCTHIIASNLTPKKKEEFRRYRIVKPAWIVDSVAAGKVLPWDLYRVIDEGPTQKILGFEDGMVKSQTSRRTRGYREQTDASFYTGQFKPQEGQGASPQDPSGQHLTPDEDIEDDIGPTPELTSSFEAALDSAAGLQDVPGAVADSGRPREFLEVKTELETPPPSSPVIGACHDKAAGDLRGESEADESGRMQDHGQPDDPDENEVVSHAVIRNSDILRAVSPTTFASMTAEEHNALLLSDPKIRKSTVVHPDFLEQYYRESRLHHLSTWKADLKSQLQALAAEKSSSQRAQDARDKLKRIPGQRRYIMHVDFDSFFAAVSLKKHPGYEDKPCVVAHGGGSGSEIASCNYPARKFGISNGMWMKRAQDLCPTLKILPYDFPAYEDASRKFYAAILATDGIVQSVSIDEALIDISAECISFGGSDGVRRAEGAVNREQTKADEIGQHLRTQVFRDTGCNVSVGIGGNILLAKVALRKAKPAGQYQLKPEDVLDFIGALEVKSLPGVAWSIGGKLEEIGIKLVRDIREVTKERLIGTLGPKTGEKIWDYSRGIDRAEVGDQVIRKSVSAEVNWGVRFENQEQVDEFMHGLCGELHNRLVKERVTGRQLTMKVMRRAADAPRDPPKHLGHGKCDTFNKSMQLGVTTNDTNIIAREAIAMLKSFRISPGELRGIGVQMQKLDPIKSKPDGLVESSQRRLPFKTAPSVAIADTTTVKQDSAVTADPIQDDVHTPEKQRIADSNRPSTALKPINFGTPTKTPLNTLGTQFVLPTQVDPTVLAELPADIRAKLARVRPKAEQSDSKGIEHQTTFEDDAAHQDDLPGGVDAIPTPSQIDPSILEALPADVRQEILAFHRRQGKVKDEQTLLPQSPRKLRTLPPMKQPAKRKRGGGVASNRTRTTAKGNDSALLQSNFVARVNLNDTDGATTTDTEPEEVDQDFLAALPDDIRAEVLDQQRQARLQRTGGIDLSLHQRTRALQRQKKKLAADDSTGPIERLLRLPPRPPKPTFTARKLSALPDLRVAISAWHAEFSDEGPYDEDIDALCRYLKDVVVDEGDMSKAAAVLRWMDWVVGEGDTEEHVNRAWETAVEKTKSEVQDAMRQRGLGKLDI